jgi:hypothetical protein
MDRAPENRNGTRGYFVFVLLVLLLRLFGRFSAKNPKKQKKGSPPPKTKNQRKIQRGHQE